jgi:hypothetical protein
VARRTQSNCNTCFAEGDSCSDQGKIFCPLGFGQAVWICDGALRQPAASTAAVAALTSLFGLALPEQTRARAMTASCLSLHQLPAGEVERNGGTHVVDNNTNDNDRHCARGSQRHSRCCWRRCDQSMKRRAAMAHSRVQPFNAEADATDARPPSQRPTTLPHRHMTDSGATAVPRCSTCDAGLCDYNAMQLAVSDRASISQSLLSKTRSRSSIPATFVHTSRTPDHT